MGEKAKGQPAQLRQKIAELEELMAGHVRKVEELERRNQELETLYEAATAISSGLSMEAVLRAVTRHMTVALGASGCAISIWHPERDAIETVVDYSRNWPDSSEYPGRIYELKDYPYTRSVLESRRTALLQIDDPLCDEAERSLMEQAEIVTLLMLPLVSGESVLGLMEVFDETERWDFGPGEIRLAENMAARAAVAIENARLYDEMAKVNELLRAEIAHHKQTGDELLENRERFRAMFEGAGIGISLVDKGGCIMESNPALQKMLGYEEEELWGMTFAELTHPEDAETDLRLHKEMMKGNLPGYQLEKRYIRKDGTMVWVSLTTSLMRDAKGMPLFDVGMVEDITERKQAETERAHLLKLEREQRMLAEALRRATAAMSSTLNYEEVLEVILQQVGLVLRHNSADIVLIEGADTDTPQMNRARVFCCRGYDRFEAEEYIKSRDFEIEEMPKLRKMQETGRPIVVPDVDGDGEWVHIPEMSWIKSYIGAPIRIRRRVIGFLNVHSTTPGFFKETDTEWLQALADQAAIAIENARLYRHAKRELAERRRAEEELRKAHDELERRVEERTAELSRANVRLTIEIAERRRAEEELQKERDFTSAVIDTAGALVVVLDSDGRIVRFNRACELTSGYPADVMKGRFIWDWFLPHEDIEPAKAVFEEMRAGRFPGEYENYWITKHGDCRLISWATTAMLDEEGQPEYLIGTGVDITERRKAEKAEESTRLKMEAVIQKMTDGLLAVDAGCNIVIANRRASELLNVPVGASSETLAGQNLSKVCPYPSLKELVKEAVENLAGITNGEIDFTETGGHDLSVTIAPFAGQDEQTLWYILLHDITSLKELDRLKSDFVSNVSHELRTPLANVKLYAALAQKGRPDRHGHYLDIIEKEAGRLEALIEDILDLSKMDRGVIELRREPVKLEDVIRQIVRAHTASAQNRGITLTWHVPESLPTLHADLNHLLLMLNNLLSNALQYTPSGGAVSVEARPGECRGSPAMLITVRDTGIGIPPEEQKRIFERFYRGRHTPKGATGTGLGLAIVAESIGRHGGEVTLESDTGKGSTFTLCFPLQTEATEHDRHDKHD